MHFQRLKSGSTAVTVLIQNNTLYVAWVGDSQVALTKNREAVKIMEPHKPEREVFSTSFSQLEHGCLPAGVRCNIDIKAKVFVDSALLRSLG